MQNEWILDVLADLQAFARLNGMDALDDQLQRTVEVAASCLAASQGRLSGGENGREGHPLG